MASVSNISLLSKVELHCHLDGVLDPAMLHDIIQNDPVFPIVPEVFEQAYPIEQFESFFDWWQYTIPIAGQLGYFYPILGQHIKRLKTQQVRYTEIMIPSNTIPRDVAKATEEFSAFRRWINKMEADQIQVEMLVAIGRNKSAEEFETITSLVLELFEAGLIVGVSLAGEERGNSVQRFEVSFARFHEARLGIEIHAGEWCGPESVWDALEYGYPDRIGHGVSLFEDIRLIDIIRERHIHIEMCPTSNLKTGSISYLKQHPITRARELELSFSINTDDPGVFGCSMQSEYELISHVFSFEDDDFKKIFIQSLNARFQPQLRIPCEENRT